MKPGAEGVALFRRPFYFLRHGETETNRLELIAGSTDVELNEAGRAQARAAIELVRPLGVTHIVSSGLRRARETATILATALDLPRAVIPGLAERGWGALEGRPRSERVRGTTPSGGETPEAFIERTRTALAQIGTQGTPLIVAHSGTFRALCQLLELEEPEAAIPNCRPVRFAPPADAGARWSLRAL